MDSESVNKQVEKRHLYISGYLSLEEYEKQLQRHRKTLVDHMEYRYGFSDTLIEKEIFTEEEMSAFDNIRGDSVMVNGKMIDMLCKKGNRIYFIDFLDAMGECWQSHLKKLVIQDGEFSDDEQDRPLTIPQLSCLKQNQRSIVQNLHTHIDDLANRLFKDECINMYHLQRITLKSDCTNLERAALLMSIMRNRSLQDVKLFRQILKERKSPVYELTDIENATHKYCTRVVKGGKSISDHLEYRQISKIAQLARQCMIPVEMVLSEGLSIYTDMSEAHRQRASGEINREYFIRITIKRTSQGLGSMAALAVTLAVIPLTHAWIGPPLASFIGRGVGTIMGRFAGEAFLNHEKKVLQV